VSGYLATSVPDVAPARESGREALSAAVLAAAMCVVGCLVGVIWAAWSPAGPAGERVPGGIIADETEAFIAGDGRFVLLTVIVGIAAGVAAWYLRSVRGPLLAVALGVGGLAGAFLTRTVGHLMQGSSPAIHSHGHVFYLHLALDVHATGLLFAEAAVAALCYALFVAFTASDDLGRPDPSREALRPTSVQPGWQPYDGGGYRDAPRPPEQGYFPPQ
jgi:hypothetical protein